MSDRPDVVVVGGGLVGVAAAYETATAGASVRLLDRADVGRATDAGAGILSPATTAAEEGSWIRFFHDAGRHHEALAGRFDTSWTRCGLLKLAMRESDLPAFEWLTDLVTTRDPSVVEIDGSEARERFPVLAPVSRALWSPDAARLDGRVCRAALVAAAIGAGAEMTAADVVRFETAGDRVGGVELSDGTRIGCGAVIVAGGAWSPAFDAALGVRIGVHPARGQILHLQTTAGDPGRWPIAHPVFGQYLVPWPDGRVAVGATYEDAAGFDPRPTASGVAEVLREALRVAPGLGDATLAEIRVGLRPASIDDRPVLGLLPGWENVAVCTGHGAEGLLLGPYSARLVVQQVLGDDPDSDLTPFRPDRPR